MGATGFPLALRRCATVLRKALESPGELGQLRAALARLLRLRGQLANAALLLRGLLERPRASLLLSGPRFGCRHRLLTRLAVLGPGKDLPHLLDAFAQPPRALTGELAHSRIHAKPEQRFEGGAPLPRIAFQKPRELPLGKHHGLAEALEVELEQTLDGVVDGL